MNWTMWLVLALILLFVSLALGVIAGAYRGIDRVTAERTKMLIESELRLGARAQEVEHFFDRHDLSYSYDKFAKRYQSIIRNVSSSRWIDQAIVIYIYIDVDNDAGFTNAEVRNSFTLL